MNQTSKRTESINSGTILNQATRTLHGVEGGGDELPLIVVDQGTDINERLRDVIYVSGVRIDLEFENSGTDVDSDMTINFAVITSRSDLNAPSATDFFRSSEGATRGRDFDETLMSSLELKNSPINTDKFLVHLHKKFILGSDSGTTNYPSQRTITKWIPIKRQFRFDGATTTPTTPVPHLVYWADFNCRSQNSGTSAAAFQILRRATIYFREPKN